MTARQETMSEHIPNKPEVIEQDALVLRMPDSARIPEGSTFYEGDDDGTCRLVRPDGSRCLGIRMKAYGLCAGHAGTSRILADPKGMQKKGAVAKVRARERRSVLVSNGLNPRKAAREQAIRRNDAIVRALVDDPLDDSKLTTMQRQKATLDMLDAVFPLAQVSAEIELPASVEQVESMDWASMQRLAMQLGAGEHRLSRPGGHAPL